VTDATDVFVYGTLTDPEQVDQVLDEWSFRGRATLSGLHRVDGRYPTLAPDGETAGRLLRTPEVDALDAYEGVDRGLYARIPVPRGDADGTVAVYVGDPERLGVADRVSWPGEGPVFDRIERVVGAGGVVVTRDE